MINQTPIVYLCSSTPHLLELISCISPTPDIGHLLNGETTQIKVIHRQLRNEILSLSSLLSELSIQQHSGIKKHLRSSSCRNSNTLFFTISLRCLKCSRTPFISERNSASHHAERVNGVGLSRRPSALLACRWCNLHY